MSILPDDIMIRVEEEFKTRAQKNIAIELLTVWTMRPTWGEMKEIGSRHDRKEKAVHTVIDRLTEANLFTDARGSMYLYRLKLEKEAKSETPLAPLPLVEPTSSQLRPEEGPDEEPSDELPPPEEPKEVDEEGSTEFIALKNQVFRMESQMDGLGKKLDAIVPVIQGLSAKKPDNPGHSPTLQVESPEVDNPDQVQQVEQSDVEPISTFLPGLSREQIIEIGANQPGKIRELMGLPPVEVGIESLPVTTRVIAVELTTYTQSVYERVVHDGYDGTMSDFLNDAAYKYFEDRGKRLDWVDTKRGRKRLQ